MNYKTALKSTGRFVGEVLLASYVANAIGGAVNIMSFKLDPETQYLSKGQRKIVSKFIPPSQIKDAVGDNPSALDIVRASHYQVQKRIRTVDNVRTLDEALQGRGNCVSYSALTYASFLNVIEKYPELHKLEKEVYMINGLNEKGQGHSWLRVNIYDIETTMDYDDNNISNSVLKTPNMTNKGDLFTNNSEFLEIKQIHVEDGNVKTRHNLENLLLPKRDYVHATLNAVSEAFLKKEMPKSRIPYSIILMTGLNALSCANRRRRKRKCPTQK